MSLLAVNTPSVPQELLDKLEKAFPPLHPQPNIHTIEEIMFEAGKREVVQWLLTQVTRRTITGHAV